jgi:hypothetical protein
VTNIVSVLRNLATPPKTIPKIVFLNRTYINCYVSRIIRVFVICKCGDCVSSKNSGLSGTVASSSTFYPFSISFTLFLSGCYLFKRPCGVRLQYIVFVHLASSIRFKLPCNSLSLFFHFYGIIFSHLICRNLRHSAQGHPYECFVLHLWYQVS